MTDRVELYLDNKKLLELYYSDNPNHSKQWKETLRKEIERRCLTK